MKKKLILLASIMTVVVILVFVIALYFNRNSKEESTANNDNIRVVTSFYPTYVLTINLTDQIPGLKVDSLTDFSAGCLHDYQLTTNDMRLLSNADIFIINGGGMEEYLGDVIDNYKDLTVIDLSSGIAMLEGHSHEGHSHSEALDGEVPHEGEEGKEDSHDEEHDVEEGGEASHSQEVNPHIWLDPDLYMLQIENARKGLEQYLTNNEKESLSHKTIEILNSNTLAYLQEVQELADEMNLVLDTVKDMVTNKAISNKVVVFHESFAYLANKAGLEVAYTVEIDEDSPLSAGEVAEIIDAIKDEGIRYMFTEEQYDDTISDRIKEETGSHLYIIDSAVTGDAAKNSYLVAMRNNINTLKKAFE